MDDGFNWLVLLFGPVWYLLNGMIGQGLGWLLAAIIAGTIIPVVGAIIVWIIAGVKANGAKEQKYLIKGWVYKGYEDEIEQQVDQ